MTPVGRGSASQALGIARRRSFFAIFILLLGFRPAAGGELVMFWRAGCLYCVAWERDIAPVYPKTEEAKRLTLRRVDLAAARPDDLRGIDDIRYAPTFVALEDGREYGRIIGYTGDDQFWGLLAQIVAAMPAKY